MFSKGLLIKGCSVIWASLWSSFGRWKVQVMAKLGKKKYIWCCLLFLVQVHGPHLISPCLTYWVSSHTYARLGWMLCSCHQCKLITHVFVCALFWHQTSRFLLSFLSHNGWFCSELPPPTMKEDDSCYISAWFVQQHTINTKVIPQLSKNN